MVNWTEPTVVPPQDYYGQIKAQIKEGLGSGENQRAVLVFFENDEALAGFSLYVNMGKGESFKYMELDEKSKQAEIESVMSASTQ